MKKEINLERLEVIVTKLDKKIDTLVDSVDDLARITAKGFENVNDRMENIEDPVKQLTVGQMDMKLRLDNTAHRFEVQELQLRVKRLEKHAGISK